MAVDTRNRRASCLGHANIPFAVYPNPDNDLTAQADRQHMAYTYPGINAEGPPAVADTHATTGLSPLTGTRVLPGFSKIFRR